MRHASRLAVLSAAVAGVIAGSRLSRAAEQFLSPNDFTIAIDAVANYYIDNTSTGGTSSMYPAAESAVNLFDGLTASKYLNFGRKGAGFIVIPGSSTVRSFQLSTANDAVGRDPTSYVLLGTNDPVQSQDRGNGLGGENWTLIQQGTLALPDTRLTAGPVVNLPNNTSYSAYKLYFPTVKSGGGENSMQISETQFWDQQNASGNALLNTGNDVRAIDNPGSDSGYQTGQGPKAALDQILDGSHKYLNLLNGTGGANSHHGAGLIVTPHRGQTVIQSFRIATANDVPTRDPVNYEIYGTNGAIQSADNSDGNGGETWTLIGSGSLTLPTARDTFSDPISLTNSTAYNSYKVVFPDNAGSGVGMQIDEIAFTGDLLAETQWGVNASGDWNSGNNWIGPLPNGVGATARLLNMSTSAHTIFTDAPITLGTLRIENSAPYQITGSGSLTMQVTSGSASINVSGATHKINLPLTIASNTTINVAAGATLKISDPVTINAGRTVTQTGAGNVLYESTVDVLSGAGMQLGSGSRMTGLTLDASASATLTLGGSGAVRAETLAMHNTATLDVVNNGFITAADRSTVQGLVRAARHGGAWDQPGMTSSAARNQADHATTLGVLTGAEYSSVGGNGSLLGQAYAASDTLVKYTYYGDTDLNGRVNFDDYLRIDNGFNNHLSGWLNGDFDLNDQVNFDDYVLIDLAFNTQNGTLGRALSFLDGSDRSGAGMNNDPALLKVQQHFSEFGNDYAGHFLSAVPEPTALALSGVLASASMLSRRSRRRSRRS
jgi:hypothetical protein